MRSHLRGILDELCNVTELLYALLVVEVLLLLLAIGGMVYHEPGTAGFVVWLLNAAGLLVLLSLLVPVIARCFHR